MRVGEELAERYAVTRELGVGGMATVWQAFDRVEQAPVALKVLHQDVPDGWRLAQEGRVQAKLTHPNLVSVRDAFAHYGRTVLVLQYIEGTTLWQRLDRHGPLPLSTALSLFCGMVAGVHHAHAHGVAHRDLKPDNVLLRRVEHGVVPMVADFGLAKLLGDDWTRALARTRSGQMMGTPGFMAPELTLDAAAAGPPADIFALGCMLFELVTGQPPFQGGLADVVAQVQAGSYTDPRALQPDLPAGVARAIKLAMRRRVHERPDCARLVSLVLDNEDGGRDPQAFSGQIVRV